MCVGGMGAGGGGGGGKEWGVYGLGMKAPAHPSFDHFLFSFLFLIFFLFLKCFFLVARRAWGPGVLPHLPQDQSNT